jgi:hypothetical protein
MLTVEKPTSLRLWGFLLTVLGGAAIAFGSISDWAAISLGNTAVNAVPTKGVDVWQGKVTLLLGVLIIVGILGLRVNNLDLRRISAVGIVVLALAASAIAVWSVSSLRSVAGDAGLAAVTAAAERTGVSAAEAQRLVAQLLDRFGIEIQAQAGLWMVIGGGVLATVGGVLDLTWVRRADA